MLSITIAPEESWDESREEFVAVGKEQKLQLEHSLVSLSKWESKWHKSFIECLQKGSITVEETIDYIKCMTLNNNVNPEVYRLLKTEHIQEVNKYISDPMTATTIRRNPNQTGSREILTSEIIYYRMIALQIPFECQKWHLNRLLTLIEVCNIKNQPPKKMSQREVMEQNRALNEARKKKWNTKG